MKTISRLVIGVLAVSFSVAGWGTTAHINAGSLYKSKFFQTQLVTVHHVHSPNSANPRGTGEIYFDARNTNAHSMIVSFKSLKKKVSFKCAVDTIHSFKVEVFSEVDNSYVINVDSVGTPNGTELTFALNKPSKAQRVDVTLATLDPQAHWTLMDCAMTY